MLTLNSTKNQNFSIQGMLNFYFETEKLNENNAYACSNCGSLQSAEKNIYATQDLINKAPEFIILNINCFSVDSELVKSLHYEKTVELKIFNNQSSNIGQTHEINEDKAKDLKYDIEDIMVIHVGATKTSGHYYTLIFNQFDQNICIKADDTNLTRIDYDKWLLKKSKNEKPYLLFFKKI